MTKRTRKELFRKKREAIDSMDDDDFDTVTTFQSPKSSVDFAKQKELSNLMSHPDLGLDYEELYDDGKKDQNLKLSTFSYMRMKKSIRVYYIIVCIISLAIIGLIIGFGIALFR